MHSHHLGWQGRNRKMLMPRIGKFEVPWRACDPAGASSSMQANTGAPTPFIIFVQLRVLDPVVSSRACKGRIQTSKPDGKFEAAFKSELAESLLLPCICATG